MSRQQQNQQALDALQPSWKNPVQNVLDQQSNDIIRQVRENATMEYKLTKQRKQEELSCRVDEAKRISKTAFKNAKKKVDNHASSVASRSRRVYLISSYEAIVKNKIQESSRLAELLLHQKAVEAKKDADIRRMQFKIDLLVRELDTMKAQISNSRSTNPSSCNSLTQDNAWVQEFAIESVPYDTTTPTAPTPRYVQPDAAQFNSLDRQVLQEEPFEDADEQANALTTYLEKVAAQAPGEGLQGVEDCLKMDGGDWGPLPVINYKEAQAQIKADTPNNVLHPAV